MLGLPKEIDFFPPLAYGTLLTHDHTQTRKQQVSILFENFQTMAAKVN